MMGNQIGVFIPYPASITRSYPEVAAGMPLSSKSDGCHCGAGSPRIRSIGWCKIWLEASTSFP
jgi:hypothetical protein